MDTSQNIPTGKFSFRKIIRQIGLIGGLSLISAFNVFAPCTKAEASELLPKDGLLGTQLNLTQDSGDMQNLSHLFLSQSKFLGQSTSITLDMIWNYAASDLELSPIREEHKQKVTQLLGGEWQSRICYQDNRLPSIQNVCDSYKGEFRRVTQKHGVLQRFTDITREIRENPASRKKYDKAIACQTRGQTYEQCF